MASVHETAYPQLKTQFTSKEIEKNFTPTADELFLMNNNTRTTSQEIHLGFMIMLKCYQCLGRPTTTNKVPSSIKLHIAEAMGINSSIFPLKIYDHSKSRKRHIKAIRNYFKINDNKNDRKQCMKKAAIHSAQTKENLADIINDMLEELVKSNLGFIV